MTDNFYWRKGWFEALRATANAGGSNPAYAEFVAYCRAAEAGLRKEAMAAARKFAHTANRWPFEQRRTFVHWLLGRWYEANRAGVLMPYPLKVDLVLPALDEWEGHEPGSPLPHRWRGLLLNQTTALQRAIDLDAAEQIARIELINYLTGDVEYATHELPWGYLGVPDDDLVTLDRATELAEGVADPGMRGELQQEIESLREVVDSWQIYCQSGSTLNFEDWAKAHERRFK